MKNQRAKTAMSMMPVMERDPVARSLHFIHNARLSPATRDMLTDGICLRDAIQEHTYSAIRLIAWDMDQASLPTYLTEWYDVVEDICSREYEMLTAVSERQDKQSINNTPHLAAFNGLRRALRLVRRDVLKQRTVYKKDQRAKRQQLMKERHRVLLSIGSEE